MVKCVAMLQMLRCVLLIRLIFYKWIRPPNCLSFNCFEFKITKSQICFGRPIQIGFGSKWIQKNLDPSASPWLTAPSFSHFTIGSSSVGDLSSLAYYTTGRLIENRLYDSSTNYVTIYLYLSIYGTYKFKSHTSNCWLISLTFYANVNEATQFNFYTIHTHTSFIHTSSIHSSTCAFAAVRCSAVLLSAILVNWMQLDTKDLNLPASQWLAFLSWIYYCSLQWRGGVDKHLYHYKDICLYAETV